jgi:hypothetical protein
LTAVAVLTAGGFAPPKENQSNREAPKKIKTTGVKDKGGDDKGGPKAMCCDKEMDKGDKATGKVKSGTAVK